MLGLVIEKVVFLVSYLIIVIVYSMHTISCVVGFLRAIRRRLAFWTFLRADSTINTFEPDAAFPAALLRHLGWLGF
jgi:hypothetical protein